MPNEAESQRWGAVVQAVVDEMLSHGQHPGGGVLISEEDQLKLSLPLKDGSRFPYVVLRGDLAKRTPQEIAVAFYAAYKKRRDQT